MTTTTQQTGTIKIATFVANIYDGKTYQVRCHSFPGRMAHKLTAEIVDERGAVIREKQFQLGTRLISNSEKLRKAKYTIDAWISE